VVPDLLVVRILVARELPEKEGDLLGIHHEPEATAGSLHRPPMT
jgi:hypothetical protein